MGLFSLSDLVMCSNHVTVALHDAQLSLTRRVIHLTVKAVSTLYGGTPTP